MTLLSSELLTSFVRCASLAVADNDLLIRKGVSFLSRIIGGKKKETLPDLPEDESEYDETRPEGMDVDVFSLPIGFTPQFPAPPKYIKVSAQNKKDREKDFDRLFLAQELRGTTVSDTASVNGKGRRASLNEAIRSEKEGNATWAMEFSRDGKYLAAAGQDKVLRVWAVISTAEERSAHETDEKSGDQGENRVHLSAPVFKSKPVREYSGHTASILDLSWSKNGFLLSSSMDKTVRLWHISRGECLVCFKHSDFVTSIEFHPRDDRFFLAGSLDSKLRLWSIPDKTVAYWTTVPGMVTAVAFTPDGKTAIAGCLNGLCIFYETESLKQTAHIHVRSARGKNAKGSKITGISSMYDSRPSPNPDIKILVTSNDSRVRVYNIKDRSLDTKFRGNANANSQIRATCSDDGRYVICGSEDRKAYIWPTSWIERDQERRPLELFEAHNTVVTVAMFAPVSTRQLLGASGDPVYDLCNPPPVELKSKAESMASSRTPAATDSGTIENNKIPSDGKSSVRPGEVPTHSKRSAHKTGNIILTSDYLGNIKVFRQDCAYQKRRHESWDSGSTFSKKLINRSSSVATRNSTSSRRTSNSHRDNPSNDRILSWRKSIANNANSRNSFDSARYKGRSVSPRKSMGQISQLSSKPASINPPSIRTTSPSGSIHKSSIDSPSKNASQLNFGQDSASYATNPEQIDDPLMLQGDQSFMYWDKSAYRSMARDAHRSPDPSLLDPNVVENRRRSFVSVLSSEESSDATYDDAEELSCSKCGSQNFRATKGAGNSGQRLVCTTCGKAV